jgi:HK97 gp10 family phage protein
MRGMFHAGLRLGNTVSKQTTTIDGDKALRKMMQQLPDKLVRKVMRQAINAAATPVLKAARSNAPRDKGVLLAGLAKKVKTYSKSMTIVGLIGPISRSAPHAHLVEKGTEPRTQKKTGRYTGRVLGSHFLQKALEENEAAALSTMKAKLSQAVPKEAARLAQKGK